MLEVTITHRFEAMHRWPAAPSAVVFLRSMHRHLFHVAVTQRVAYADRDVEFFDLQRKVSDYISRHLAGTATTKSCEQMALEICRHFRAERVSVSEDGENTATVIASSLPVADMTRSLPFVGTEIEGPWAGEDVTGLYIPCTDDAAKYVSDELGWLQRIVAQRNISLVYVGAGNKCVAPACMGAFTKICEAVISSKIGVQSVVELQDMSVCSSVLDTLPAAITVLRSQLHQDAASTTAASNDVRSVNYVKWLDCDNIVWQDVTTHRCHTTWLRDPLFDADTPVFQFLQKA
jgi:hypothetical protein